MPFKSVDSLKTQSLKPFLLPWINYFFLRISISAENLAGGTRDTIRSILAGESTLSGIQYSKEEEEERMFWSRSSGVSTD